MENVITQNKIDYTEHENHKINFTLSFPYFLIPSSLEYTVLV